MRTLNVPLAIVLGVLVMVLGGTTYFVHKLQMVHHADLFKHEADAFLEQATEAEKNKDEEAADEAYQQAIRNLGWFVRLKPQETDTMEKLGLLMADRAKDSRSFGQAFALLESLLRREPERQKARRRVIDMAMSHGLYRDAKAHLRDFLLPQTPKDKQSDLWGLLGQCNAQTGDYDTAVENYRQAIELSPSNVEVYARLAAVLRFRQNRTREADELMEKVVEVNPKSYRAHFLRGSYLKGIEEEDEAFAEAMEALKLAPDDHEVLLLAISCYVAQKDFDKARVCAAHALKLKPDGVDVYLAMSQVELAAADRDKAIAVLREGLRATKRDPQLLWRLGAVLIDANQLREAKQAVTDLRAASGSRRWRGH